MVSFASPRLMFILWANVFVPANILFSDMQRYCVDFFEQVYAALDNMLVNYDNDIDAMANSVMKHINNMLPLRNECLSVIETMLDYKPVEEAVQEIRR